MLITVLGAAGIGKTRLAAEFAARVAGRAQVLQGRCLSYGEGITFWPLQEILRSLPARPPDGPRPEDARSVEETFWAYRKLLETVARDRPLLLVIEDIHWAEPTLLDMIEHIVEWTHDAPMMFLCLARPELMDSRPGWPGERIELEPLGKTDAQTLAQELGGGLDSRSRERAITVAEGNPLFLEQMLAFVADEEPGDVHVPQTIHALLTTRLDQLEPNERGLLEAASVVGKEFWRGALLSLSPSDSQVSPLLLQLVRRRLIQPEPSSLPGEDAFRFGHILIREATYAGMPKERRATLHERFADWLEELETPYEEIVGYHLEQAYRYMRELGAVDAAALPLGHRAGITLALAGARASKHGDVSSAASLLDRAKEVLATDDPRRREVLLLLGSTLVPIGQPDRARAVLGEAVEGATAVGDRKTEWQARLEQRLLGVQFDPQSNSDEALLRDAEDAAEIFEELGDVHGQAKAFRLKGQALYWMGQRSAAANAAERAAALALKADDWHERVWALSLLAHALYDGPTPVQEAIPRLEQILALAGDDRQLRASILRKLASLHSAQDDHVKARRLIDEALAICEEFGLRIWLASTLGFESASLHLAAGDSAAAEADLRHALEILVEMNEKSRLSTLAAALAGLLAEQERDEEAERFLAIAEETGGADDWVTQAWTKSARSVLLAHRQEFETAIRESRDGLALVDATDDIEGRGWHRFELAKILIAANRPDEVARLLNEAVQLFEEKGHLRGIAETRALLVELEGSTASR
jgi:predicted ATPase